TKFNPINNRRRQPGEPINLKEERQLGESLERSLDRLQTDRVDVYHLHGVPPDWYAPSRDRFYPLLKRAQEQGKIRFIGLTETFAEDDQHETLTMGLAD